MYYCLLFTTPTFSLIKVLKVYFYFILEFSENMQEEYRTEAILSHLMLCIQSLATDANQHVKSALASVIMGLSPIVGKEKLVCKVCFSDLVQIQRSL